MTTQVNVATILFYGSGRVEVWPDFFWCRRGGIDLSNAYSVVPAWLH